MLFQDISSGFLHDFLLVIRMFAVVLIFYLIYQIAKRIKEAGFISATMGFLIFLLGFGIMNFFITLALLYPGELLSNEFLLTINYMDLGSMAIYVILTEIDGAKHAPDADSDKFKYPLTAFSVIGLPILCVISQFNQSFFIFATIYILIPVVNCTEKFMERFENLEIVKQTKPLPWFFTGLSLAGFSNFVYLIFPDPNMVVISLMINTICMIFGSFMMSYAWNRLPNLSELNWMQKMEMLMVVNQNSSMQMYQYEFQKRESDIESDLASSAISGVDMLFKEILATEGHLSQIQHADKTITFSHGLASTCILITKGTSDEFRYRLNLFHLAFEKIYGAERLKTWGGDLAIFKKSDDIIRRYFLL